MKGNTKSKIIVPILMASIAGTMLATNVRDMVVYAFPAYNYLGAEITVTGFKSTGKVGDEYTLPNVTVNDGSYTIVRELEDPKGSTLKNVTTTFRPAYSGTYTLKYKALKDDTVVTTTDTMKITVSKSDYAIELPTNSPYVILDTVKTGTTLRIPLPTLTKDEEEETDYSKLTVTVTGENNQATTFTGSSDTDVKTDSNGVKYFEYVPSIKGVYEIVYKYEDGGANQAVKSQRFIAKDNYNYDNIKLSMDYTSYTKPTTAVIGNEVTLPTLSTVSIVDTNNGSATIKAYLDVKVYYRGTATNRLTTPEEVAVVDSKFTPTLAGDYSVTVQARISHFNGTTETKIETVSSTWEISDVKDSEAPEPIVVNSYKVEDGEITEIANGYTTGGDGLVTENFVAVDENATDEEILDLLSSRANSIPSIVVIPDGSTEVKVAIPAIFATDNAVNGTSLVYTRSVRDTSDSSTTTINKGFDGTTVVSNGEIAYYTFKNTGTYTIRYKAADSSESSANTNTISYTVKVVNQNDITAYQTATYAPNVTLSSFSEYVYNNTSLVFNKPSVSNTITSDYSDVRMDVNTTYQFVCNNGIEFTTDEVAITEVNDDGKYELDLDDIITSLVSIDARLSDASQVQKIIITASATNDLGVTGTVKRTIDLINTIDSNTPVIVSDGNNFEVSIATENGVLDNESFTQRSNIVLPDMQFSDTDGSVLSSSIRVTDPNDSSVALYNSITTSNVVGGVNTITIKNGYFIAEYAGVYNIRYAVKDSGGNSVYATYGIRVILSETPTVYLANIADFESTEYQLGTEIFPPKAGLYLNGEYVTSDDSTSELTIETSWTISPAVWSDDLYPAGLTNEEKIDYKEEWEILNRVQAPEITQINGKNVSFTPYVAGSYTIRYTGSYTTNPGTLEEVTKTVEDERVITITVKDLTTPEITILEEEYKTYPIYINTYVANNEVVIPGFKVTGSYDMDSVTREVRVTGYDGTTITPKYIKTLDEYSNTDEMYTEMGITSGSEGAAEKLVEFQTYHESFGGMYSFIPNGNGTHTVYYVAVDGNGNESKSSAQYVYVGDCENPELDFGTTEVQESIIPTSVDVGTDFELNMSELVKYCTDNVSAIDDEDSTLTVTAVLRNSSGTKQTNLFGTDSNRYKWEMSETGNYTLYITLTDAAGKTTTREFTIESVAEESSETKVTEIVGIIMIVLSLAVLAGVIIYFVVTGRKLQPKATKKVKGPKGKK